MATLREREPLVARLVDDQLVLLNVHACSGRSGTTMLMQLLGTCDVIAFDHLPPFEVQLLGNLARSLEIFDQQHRADLAALHVNDGSVALHGQSSDLWRAIAGDAIDALTESVRAWHPITRYLAEKLPDHELDVFRNAGVSTRTIQLVRDPRDTHASILAFDQQRGFSGFGRADGESDMAYLARWIDEVDVRLRNMAHGAQDAEMTLVVRYEDLVTDLVATTRRIEQWLGVCLDPTMIGLTSPAFAAHVTSDSIASSIGRWRRDLAPAATAMIEERLGEHLIRFGYS